MSWDPAFKDMVVAQGLIVDINTKKVLMAHRPLGKKKPLMWEYPGGKLDPGETPEETIIRELKEELDIDVKINKLIYRGLSYFQENTDTYLYAITEWTGEPKPLVASELRWVDPSYAIDWLPILSSVGASYRYVLNFLKELP